VRTLFAHGTTLEVLLIVVRPEAPVSGAMVRSGIKYMRLSLESTYAWTQRRASECLQRPHTTPSNGVSLTLVYPSLSVDFDHSRVLQVVWLVVSEAHTLAMPMLA